MRFFAPREATTTAEPPEPLAFQHSEIILFKQILQQAVGPAARHFGLFCVFCGLFIRVHSWFKIKYFQLLVRRINNVTSGRANTLNGGPHVPVPGDVYIFKPSGNS